MRLAAGWEAESKAERAALGQFFYSQQNDDGGFRGRSPQSDLYYTAFALRGLAVLGHEDSAALERTSSYLRSAMQGSASVIDLVSLVFAARLLDSWTGACVLASAEPQWNASVAGVLEALRRPDGGYAKTLEGHASSTYQTFLTTLAYELLELPLPEPESAAEFLLGQQRDDGGFVEIGVMRRSGVNPTAAAVGALRVLGQGAEEDRLSDELKEDVAEFLLDNFTDEGGLRANTQIPIADLLSTFTGLLTLHDVGAFDQVDLAAAKRFVDSVRQPTGGFLAAAWDELADVEYSFYGVATLGLLGPS